VIRRSMRIAGPLCLLATVAAGRPDPFLTRLRKALAEVKSFRATFVQEKKLKVFSRTVTSSGVILFSRPEQLRWETVKPFRSVLIVSGDSVAKFEWVGGKRRKLDLGRSADAILVAMRRIRDWFTGKFDERNYEVEVGDGVIILRPRDKRMRKAIESFEFHPTRDLKAMQRVVVREPGGDSTTMRFSNHDPKYVPPKGAFSLSDPADVR